MTTPNPTPHRRRLPGRRPSETRTLTVGSQQFTACVGFNPQDGGPQEIFLDGAKAGSSMEVILADASVVISVALQSGVPAAALAKSVARLPSAPLTPADLAEVAGPRHTAPASIIGAALDLLRGFETDG